MLGKYLCILIFISYSLSGFSQKTDIEKSGDLIQIILPSSAFISSFKYKDYPNNPKQFIKSMSVCFIVTHSLKRIINKKRPNGGEHGVPSGHTSAAFTGAAFIERKYGWRYGVPSYILASYVGWTRIYANKHDYADVISGLVLGISSSYLFTKPFNNNININIGYLKEPLLVITLNI